MNVLRIAETTDTPEVNLDSEKGRFEFLGKSMPEDPKEFFKPIINWFKEYVNNPNKETILVFKFDYINTASSKRVLDILTTCQEIHRKKMSVVVYWYYRPSDEDMFDTGETFSEIVHIPFKLIPL